MPRKRQWEQALLTSELCFHKFKATLVLRGDNPPHLVKKMKFGIFNFFLLGAVNKHPNCVKMKFEGDLTSIMVTRDFLGTATTTRFALTRQGNGCGELLWCGWQS